MGGAAERPAAEHVWSAVSRALDEPAGGTDAPMDEKPRFDTRGVPWPLFVALLVANGWCVSPRGFPHSSAGPATTLRVRRALLRIPVFVAAWVAAFWLLPTVWAGAALTLWVAWITPRIRFVHLEFQNETPPLPQPRPRDAARG